MIEVLQTTGIVLMVGGGKVYVDGPDPVPGEEALGVPASPDQERAYAALLMKEGGVRITIEPMPPPPEPLTGSEDDINVRVRVKRDWIAGSFLAGKTGVLAEHTVDAHAVVRLDDGHFYTIPVDRIERAPAECPHCGAGRDGR